MILTKLSKSHLDIAGRAIASSSKTVCCQRVAAARRYSARAEGQGSGRESAWDDQLSFLMDTESKPPSQGTSSSGQSTSGPWWDNLLSDMSPDSDPFGSKSDRRPRLRNNNRPPRRVSMTVKERQVLDSMFDDIFNVSNGKVLPPQDGPADASGSTVDDRSSRFNQILNSARRRDRKHVMNAQQELDTMTEAIDRAMTDLELLQWAERHVFAVSIEYAEAANNAIRAALAGGASVRKSVDMLPPLQAPAYAEVLARLMRAFREKWRDPHLALAVFEHARTLSVYSYTYGCTTPAYNELLETRWTCFRDLVGFKLAVDEMNANGIRPDSRTLDIWERVRREAGFSVESQSVRELIAQIDLAISPSRKARLSKSALRDPWGPQKVAKAGAAGRNRWRDPEVQKAGGLEFGDWGESDEKGVREEDNGVEAEVSPPLEESEEDLAKAERRLESSLL